MNAICTKKKMEEEKKTTTTYYTKEIAMRHYRLACIDYFRFILGRFWGKANPESFEKKKHSGLMFFGRFLLSALLLSSIV